MVGMGLNYMIETMPFTDVLMEGPLGVPANALTIDWTFLGQSMPVWTLIWYIGLTVWLPSSLRRGPTPVKKPQ